MWTFECMLQRAWANQESTHQQTQLLSGSPVVIWMSTLKVPRSLVEMKDGESQYRVKTNSVIWRHQSEEIPAERSRECKRITQVINKLKSAMQKCSHTNTTANGAECVRVMIYPMKRLVSIQDTHRHIGNVAHCSEEQEWWLVRQLWPALMATRNDWNKRVSNTKTCKAHKNIIESVSWLSWIREATWWLLSLSKKESWWKLIDFFLTFYLFKRLLKVKKKSKKSQRKGQSQSKVKAMSQNVTVTPDYE